MGNVIKCSLYSLLSICSENILQFSSWWYHSSSLFCENVFNPEERNLNMWARCAMSIWPYKEICYEPVPSEKESAARCIHATFCRYVQHFTPYDKNNSCRLLILDFSFFQNDLCHFKLRVCYVFFLTCKQCTLGCKIHFNGGRKMHVSKMRDHWMHV